MPAKKPDAPVVGPKPDGIIGLQRSGPAWVEQWENETVKVTAVNWSDKSPGRDNTIRLVLRLVAKFATTAQLKSAGLQRIEKPVKAAKTAAEPATEAPAAE